MAGRVFDDDRPTVDIGVGVRVRETGQNDVLADDLGPDPDAATSADVHAFGGVTQPLAQPGMVDRPLGTQQIPSTPAFGQKASQTGSMSRAMDSRTAAPVEALRSDEIARSRVFLKVAFFISVGGALIASITTGDRIAQRVVGVGSALGTIGAAWMLLRMRDEAAYTPSRWLPPGLFLVAGAISGLYYWGVASPVAAMLTYGIYFFSLSSSRALTFFVFLLIAVSHGVLFLLVIAGVLDDRGLVNVATLKSTEQITLVVIVESLYTLAFITARLSQRVTLEAMTKLEGAVRGMAQREALLAEARAELDRALKIGGPGRFTEQVVGSFRLGILIGRGGMGEVYEARATSGAGDAAVKLLHPGTLADPTSVARFIREARTASSLNTPHVVRVLEVGTTAGDLPFLAMERLRGNDLAHHLRKHRRLGLTAVNEVAQHTALGLEAAREAGIVHRDLKPHNVFLADYPNGERRWKILDFGVSKAGGHGTLTQGHVVGTPAYMAPEQARGEDVDHRADVYSLAAILYRASTGHPAFTGKDVPTTLYDVVYRIPTQPSTLVELPTDVDRVLAIGLAKSTNDRFTTALELAEWFGAAIEQRLSPAQRERADELIARQPWGTRAPREQVTPRVTTWYVWMNASRVSHATLANSHPVEPSRRRRLHALST